MSTSNGQSLIVQGRIVWTSGDLFKGQHQKDDRTKQLKYDQSGNPVIVYGFGLAIPKFIPGTQQFTDAWVQLYQIMQGEALALYPNGQIPPQFAFKYKDGDTDIDPNGAKYSEREGYAGHVVVACTTQIPIKYFRFEGGNNILVSDGIKCGDYVNVQLNIKAHGPIGQGKPGLYVNPSAVQLIQSGKEIINVPSGDTLFGTSAPVYSGQVEAAPAPTMPNMAAPQAPAMPNMGQPAMPAAPQQAPAHYGVLPQTHQPAAAPQAPAMPPIPSQGQQQQQQYQQPAMTPPMPGQYR